MLCAASEQAWNLREVKLFVPALYALLGWCAQHALKVSNAPVVIRSYTIAVPELVQSVTPLVPQLYKQAVLWLRISCVFQHIDARILVYAMRVFMCDVTRIYLCHVAHTLPVS